MNRMNVSFFSLLLIGLGACKVANGQKDLALNKPYTLSAAPNYGNTANADDKTSLTDGNFTKGYFWNNKGTVGWNRVPKVEIEIDLGQSTTFNKITFNTARSVQALVYFPTNVFVFVSDNKSTYQYIGDVMDNDDNVSGEYKIESFQLKTGAVKARYVKLVALVQGTMLFCDEIQIFNTGAGAAPGMEFSSKPVNAQVDSLLQQNVPAKVQNMRSLEFRTAMGASSSRGASGAAFASQMKQQLGTNFTVNFFNAWDGLNAVYKPVKRSQDNVNVKTVINGHSFVGLIVTNLSQDKVTFSINSKTDQASSAVTLYTVPYLASHLDYRQTADPLQAAGSSVSLDAGESRLFLAEITGRSAGSSKTSISVSDGKTSQGVSIVTTVANVKFNPNDFSLNTNVYAYLNYPMLQPRKAQAVKDMYEHHVNTAVIPPAALGDMSHPAASALSDYLAAFSSYKPKNLVLYVNLVSPENKSYAQKNAFLSDAWKANFNTWYQNISKVITQSGYDMQNVFIYPYDEISEGDVDQLLSFAKWAKSAIPRIKLYMTIGRLSNNAIASLTPFIDVMQVLEETAPNVKMPAEKTWLYNTKGNAELLSPYSYYRLMSWRAFANDYKGVGFWAYLDQKDPSYGNVLKARYFPASGNFAAVYVDGNNIVSSRRWEGFMMGIEDYELLQLYAKKVGPAKAKALATSVVNAPGDALQADAARDKIITALSE